MRGGKEGVGRGWGGGGEGVGAILFIPRIVSKHKVQLIIKIKKVFENFLIFEE